MLEELQKQNGRNLQIFINQIVQAKDILHCFTNRKPACQQNAFTVSHSDSHS